MVRILGQVVPCSFKGGKVFGIKEILGRQAGQNIQGHDEFFHQPISF
jgi:hypothetical protein